MPPVTTSTAPLTTFLAVLATPLTAFLPTSDFNAVAAANANGLPAAIGVVKVVLAN